MGSGDWNGSHEDYASNYAESAEYIKAREEKEREAAENYRKIAEEKERLHQIWREEHPLEAKKEDEEKARQDEEKARQYVENKEKERICHELQAQAQFLKFQEEEARRERFGVLVGLSIIAFIGWLFFYTPSGSDILFAVLAVFGVFGLIKDLYFS